VAKHFRRSPSAAYRYIVCPGSLQYESTGDRSSSYANEGTQAHAVATKWLDANIVRYAYELPEPGEMRDACKVFVDYCEPVAGTLGKNCDVYGIEETLASPVDEDRGGTPDFYAVKGTHATIVDFKYGVGVPVAAEKNAQLLSYARLLLERFPQLETFTLVIVQPRTAGEAVDTWEATRADVDAFAARESAAAAQSHFSAGEHCRWCPAVAVCDHLHAKALELAQGDFAIEAAADRWPQLMRLKPAIEKLLDAIPGRMLDAMRKGHSFPGFKAVKALGNRTWAHDEAATLRALTRRKLGKRIVCETRLKSPTALDREGHGEQIADLVTRPDRGLTVVAMSDKRPAVTFETAAESFDDLSFLD
jgi:hypothetical protein